MRYFLRDRINSDPHPELISGETLRKNGKPTRAAVSSDFFFTQPPPPSPLYFLRKESARQNICRWHTD